MWGKNYATFHVTVESFIKHNFSKKKKQAMKSLQRMVYFKIKFKKSIQARIAQLVAYRHGTGEVPGSNPGKGENFSVKINNWIV